MILLERAQQLEQLDRLLGEAEQGRGKLVALLGEAGAGKTTLVREFVSRAMGRAAIFRGACEDFSIPDALGPLYDIAREAGWMLPRSAETPRLELFSDALKRFTDGSKPSVVVIEDAHWADDATLDFLRFLGRRITAQPVLLLVTARNDGSEGQRRVRRALGDLSPEQLLRIDVEPLTEVAVRTLAANSGLDATAIHRAAAGNAFFVSELLRAGSDKEPSPVLRDVILARAERLSPTGRSVLDLVSVFPRRAETEILLDLGGAEVGVGLPECLAHAMLVDLGEGYSFRHEIARQAIEAALSGTRRRELHARVLAALERKPDVPVARLVHHAKGAQDLDALRLYAPRAAQEASRIGAHREAAGHYATALEQADRFEVQDRAALLEAYAFECHLVGPVSGAVEAQLKAMHLHQALGDKRKEGDCLRWLSRFSYILGERQAADKYAHLAADLLETVNPGPELALAIANLSQLASLADNLDGALAFGERAVNLATDLGRPEIVCTSLINAAYAKAWVDPEGGRRDFDEALALGLRLELPEHTARAYTNRSCFEIRLLYYAAARTFLDRGIQYCIERDLVTWVNYMRGWLAELNLLEGDFEGSERVARQVLGSDAVSPLIRYPATIALARVLTRRGEPEARELVAEAGDTLQNAMELQRLAPYAVLLAERAWIGEGDREQALRLIDHAAGLAPNRSIHSDLYQWRRLLKAEGEEGDSERTAEPYRAMLAGNWRAAADGFETVGAPFERALALLEGDEEAKLTALTVLEGLGAIRTAEHVRDLLRASGISRLPRGPTRATKANFGGLTDREMEVLAFLGRGLSNKRIALQLSISPKTVDHHVSAVLGKLEANSRVEAAAIARDAGLF